jgi:hypothetical protein
VNQYIGFDDRLLILFGIPIVTLFASLVFSRLPVEDFIENFWYYFPTGLAFTLGYWFWNRTLIIVLRRRFPDIKKTLKRNVLQLLFAFLGYPIVGWLVHVVLHGLLWVIHAEHVNDEESLVGLLTTYMLTFMILAIYEAVYFFKQYKKAIIDQERIQTEHVNTQLISLRNQVNPHFLFNSLNTLMSLIPSEASHAHQYLNKLSSFYRYTVSEREELLVPLSKEIDIVQLYADLIKERFGAGLELDIDLDSEMHEFTLPMTLQLLVENAVKHNIVSKDNPLKVIIYKEAGYIHVENNMQARITETESTGMGLKNIRERFAFVSKEPVHIHSQHGMFKVSIPLINKSK